MNAARLPGPHLMRRAPSRPGRRCRSWLDSNRSRPRWRSLSRLSVASGGRVARTRVPCRQAVANHKRKGPMLRQVAEGVLIHQSEFLQTNAVVVQGRSGVLVIDPGIRGDEMACLANDLSDLGQTVVAGFSTHPHWDHLLWHASLGAALRYGTARCAATVRDRLVDAHAAGRIAEQLIPPDIVEQVPLDLLGLITGLPAET